MPTLRGASGASLETPLLLVGCALLLFLALALFRYNELRDRRLAKQRMHEPLRLDAAAPLGALDQISRRKQDLNRFIDRLRTQLAAREEQLRVHDELEEIVTSRIETTNRHDKEWRKIMKAGKKLHGRKWDASNGDTPSLRELMELHKEELLAYKAEMSERQHSARSKASARDARIMQLPPHQWMRSQAAGDLDDIAVALRDNDVAAPSVVPLLDFSKLATAATGANVQHDDHGAPKKSFELAFQRQALFAKTLKKKK